MMQQRNNSGRTWRLAALAALLALTLALAGCGAKAPSKEQAAAPAAPPETLTVAAAADLAVAFKELGQNFEKATGSKVEFSFGSTGMLAQQIENGAPFDIFAAANVSFVEGLKSKGKVIADTQKLYARGRIGLTTLASSPLAVKELADLTKPEIKKIAIANPEHAPYGLAAKQALEKAGVWDKIQDKLVYGKNIQDTLTLIQTGNAEAGIIALSLVKQGEVNFSLIDGELHKPLDQAMAVISGTKHEALARKFVDYVNNSEGRAIMKKYGFVLPGEM